MPTLSNIAYLVSSALFILGLKNLSSPKTARTGNVLAMSGMLLAVLVTLLDKQIVDFTHIVAGVVVGSFVGVWVARKVSMTAMPQTVAVFNGFGGAASALVAMAEYVRMKSHPQGFEILTLVLGVLVGTLTLTGSLIAFGKLQGLVSGKPLVFPLQKTINALLLLVILGLGALFFSAPEDSVYLYTVCGLSAVLGVLLVMPIGGADMPVVISLLNSYSGLAASMTGFVMSNNVLIISGALVGASGLILTHIMCKAMNRSLTNVLFGAVGTGDESGFGGTDVGDRRVVGYTPDDVVVMLDSAQSVIIVPGYGLAVAQAQHVTAEMASILMQNGVRVRYAIHPVAGRMPGHMNVLLADANVAYDQLFEMDAINEDFKETDVVLVLGANDVVNPAARSKKDSPLYGMPILNVDQAKTVVICKRSLRPGFAGEDNELFYASNAMMVFGDAKDTLGKIVQLLKAA